MTDRPNALTYKDAGVDIDAGNALVERIRPAAKSTDRPGVVAGLGGFGGLFDLRAAGYIDPVIVAATDGAGTKLRIAIDTGVLVGQRVGAVGHGGTPVGSPRFSATGGACKPGFRR